MVEKCLGGQCQNYEVTNLCAKNLPTYFLMQKKIIQKVQKNFGRIKIFSFSLRIAVERESNFCIFISSLLISS